MKNKLSIRFLSALYLGSTLSFIGILISFLLSAKKVTSNPNNGIGSDSIANLISFIFEFIYYTFYLLPSGLLIGLILGFIIPTEISKKVYKFFDKVLF